MPTRRPTSPGQWPSPEEIHEQMVRLAGEVTVYVPRPGSDPERQIAARSGIVGRPGRRAGDVHVYYEGNIYGFKSQARYADRVHTAFGRLSYNNGDGYPTIAQAVLPEEDLVPVGRWDQERGEVVVTHPVALAAYLGVPAVPPAELEAQGHRWEERRVLERLEQSEDPADRRQAAAAREFLRRRRR